MQSSELRDQLREARRRRLDRYAALDPAQLTEARPWRGVPLPLRFHLNWLAEGDDARRVQIEDTLLRLGRPLSVAQRALIILGEARGRLLGALVGLPNALFDQQPAEGEWSVRQTLGHIIATDRRYLIAVQYALERQRSGSDGPLRPPDSALPARTGEAEAAGTRDEVMTRLLATRDEIVAAVVSVPDDLLDAPTNWVVLDVDVRFRIHRFAAHDREHTIQIRKTLHALGFVQSELQLLLTDAIAARCALEAVLAAVPDELLQSEPSGGGPSIAETVHSATDEESSL